MAKAYDYEEHKVIINVSIIFLHTIVVPFLLQMDDDSLDQSQCITVRCQHCNEYYSLREIKTHMALHTGEVLSTRMKVQVMCNIIIKGDSSPNSA